MDVSGLGGNSGIAANRGRDTSQVAQQIEAQEVRQKDSGGELETELNRVRDAANEQRVPAATSGTESQSSRNLNRSEDAVDGVAREFSRVLAERTEQRAQVEQARQQQAIEQEAQNSEPASDGGRNTRVEP